MLGNTVAAVKTAALHIIPTIMKSYNVAARLSSLIPTSAENLQTFVSFRFVSREINNCWKWLAHLFKIRPMGLVSKKLILALNTFLVMRSCKFWLALTK